MHRPPARRARRLAVALSLLAAGGPACADDGPAGSSAPHVVAIAAQPCDRPQDSRGVGVVVAPGLVVTAGHVVEGPRRRITVDGARATTIVVDPRTDLALLAADVSGTATLTGRPTGATHLATPAGDIAVDVLRTGRLVVHDATDRARYERRAHTLGVAVDEGTSGAPLVDATGAVAGIVVLVDRDDARTYAVSGDEVVPLLAVPNRNLPAGVPCRD